MLVASYPITREIGKYKINRSSNPPTIKIIIKMNKAYKEVNSYLKEQGGIGNSLETLTTKLIQLGEKLERLQLAEYHFQVTLTTEELNGLEIIQNRFSVLKKR